MSFTIYPAIDLYGGKVVRLKEGNPAHMTIYSDDPARSARRWLNLGATWLHVVNLNGAFGENDNANRLALQSIMKVVQEYNAHIQFGGGVRSIKAIENVIELNVSRVVLGTLTIDQPEVVAHALTCFGAERIAVGIDSRDGLVRVHGWKDNSGIPAVELALQMRNLGLQTVISTDVARDGLGRGLNIPFTRKLADLSGLNVIASGGVHTLDDVLAACDANLSGVIVGRSLYEGTLDLGESLDGVSNAH
jgi:phosphoribosylformimino-5-aminoimidazole carboxamide ribotide isomerase